VLARDSSSLLDWTGLSEGLLDVLRRVRYPISYNKIPYTEVLMPGCCVIFQQVLSAGVLSNGPYGKSAFSGKAGGGDVTQYDEE
jgi:hypothetical protein